MTRSARSFLSSPRSPIVAELRVLALEGRRGVSRKKITKKTVCASLQLSSASYSMLGRAVVVRCLWSLAPGPAQTTLCHATAAPWGFASGAAPARPATASRAAPFSGTLRMPRLRYWVETAARVRGGGGKCAAWARVRRVR